MQIKQGGGGEMNGPRRSNVKIQMKNFHRSRQIYIFDRFEREKLFGILKNKTRHINKYSIVIEI